jgi:hypothetical protein
MGKKEVILEPGDPLKLSQQELDRLGEAFVAPGHLVTMDSLALAVEDILNARLINKFRILIEPIKGVRHIEVWLGETLFFSGAETGKPSVKAD